MALTAEQKVTLKADIEADPAFAGLPHNSDGAWAIAEAYNLPADPVFRVWKTDFTTDDVRKNVVWTEYIAATSAAERDAFKIITQNGIVNSADPNVRQAFLDIFSGPQKAITRSQLAAASVRDATRIEALLATGDGIGGTATMTHQGSISYSEVQQAMGW